ncbi:MAG: DUF3418 domain-containing protein, partial [Burkholderiales bacterium]
NRFALEYHFEPRSPKDGVTMTVPAALLNQVPAARCEWLVPGMLKEKAHALARAMPQRLRHKLGPLDRFAGDFAAVVPACDTPLAQALARYIRAEFGVEVPADAFRPDSAPAHLQMNFRVVDADGRQLGLGRNLAELRREWAPAIDAALRADSQARDGERYTSWTFGDLQEVMEIERDGQWLVGYPAVLDCGDAVTLEVSESPDRARAIHRAGVRRLLAIAFRERIREIEKAVAKDVALAPLKSDLVTAALERTFLSDSLPATQADFARRVENGRSRFSLIAQELQRLAAAVLAEQQQVMKRLNAAQKAFPEAAADVRRQCESLLAPAWLARTPWSRLQHLPRYLRAVALRLDKLRADPSRDRQRAGEMAALEQAYRRELASRAKLGTVTQDLEQFGWLLEELRVSLFAQELKTPVPVSAKRLAKLWHSMQK